MRAQTIASWRRRYVGAYNGTIRDFALLNAITKHTGGARRYSARKRRVQGRAPKINKSHFANRLCQSGSDRFSLRNFRLQKSVEAIAPASFFRS